MEAREEVNTVIFIKRIRNLVGGRSARDPEKIPDALTVAGECPAVQERHPEPGQAAATADPGRTPEPAPVSARLGRLQTLTPREREVYGHLLQGRKLKEIAALLNITYATANFHCQGLYKKLSVNTRAQLFIQYASLDAGRGKTGPDKNN